MIFEFEVRNEKLVNSDLLLKSESGGSYLSKFLLEWFIVTFQGFAQIVINLPLFDQDLVLLNDFLLVSIEEPHQVGHVVLVFEWLKVA